MPAARKKVVVCPALEMVSGFEDFEKILPLFANPVPSRTYQHDLPYRHKLEGSSASWEMPSAMAMFSTRKTTAKEFWEWAGIGCKLSKKRTVDASSTLRSNSKTSVFHQALILFALQLIP